MCVWGAQAASLLSSAACRRLPTLCNKCYYRTFQELFGKAAEKDRLAACAPRKQNALRVIFCLYEPRSHTTFRLNDEV
jgi:hypothetical protein